ncbi:agmatinase [bacterium 210820-DFI.6.37]|nr:agmatinase [bacterium 210820-DFI.6.37]
MLENSRLLNDSWLRWSAASKEDAKLCIMGVPFDNAVSLNKGASKGPETIRNLSIDMSDVTEDWIAIKDGILYDIGDIPVELQWDRYFERVKNEAYALMKSGKFCLFIGGDHSVTIPLHKAFGKYQKELTPGRKIGVIHFDAHFDLCREYDGHKWSHACTEARSLEDVISGEDLLFTGVRVAELDELKMLERNPGITIIRAADVHNEGPETAFQKIKAAFRDYDAIYLTIDIDVLDPAFAPGTGTPASGGLTSVQLIYLFKKMLEELPIKAMDIVEVAPDLDVNNITSWAALRIIQELFGYFSKF